MAEQRPLENADILIGAKIGLDRLTEMGVNPTGPRDERCAFRPRQVESCTEDLLDRFPAVGVVKRHDHVEDTRLDLPATIDGEGPETRSRRRTPLGSASSLWACLCLVVLFGASCVSSTHYITVKGYRLPDANGPGAFIAGANRVDITPPAGYPMAGYGPAGALARGYWTRLYARAFYLRDEKGQPVVLVSCDLWAIPAGLHARVAQLVNKERRVYLPPERLVIAATHTHHGPGNYASAEVHNGFASFYARFDPRLFEWLSKRIAEAVVEAAASASDAQLELRVGHATGIQRNRSIVPFRANAEKEKERITGDSRKAGTTCPAGIGDCPAYLATDPTLTTLTIRSGGCATGVLAFYAVHPSAIPPTAALYTAGLFGIASYLLETEAPSCRLRPYVAGFFNGAEGDISADWHERGRDDAVRLGKTLASAVTDLNDRPAIVPAPTLDVAHKSVPRHWPSTRWQELHDIVKCRFRRERPEKAGFSRCPKYGVAALGGAIDGYTLLHQLGWHAGIRKDDPEGDHGFKEPGLKTPAAALGESLYFGEVGKAGLVALTGVLGSSKSFPEEFPLTLVRIGDALTLATVPVEMTTIMGLQVREALKEAAEKGQIVVVGLANEYFSYVATSSEYDLQFYEGAATILGRREGDAVVDLLKKLSKAPVSVPGDKVETREFRAGPDTDRFGPLLVRPRDLLLEALEPFLPELGRHAGSALPRFAWFGPVCGDWRSSEREVAIQRRMPDGGYEVLDTDAGYDLLNILTDPGKVRTSQDVACRLDESRPAKARTWTAVWLEGWAEMPETYRFAVTLPGLERQRVCSEDFVVSALEDDGHPIPQAPC